MKKAVFILLVLFLFIGNLNAQEGKMHAGAQVGISLPMGSFGDIANMGFGFAGNFFYGINNNIDVTGSIGYISWGTDFDEISYSNIPILAGARYYFQKSQFTPYGLAELGMNLFSIDLPEYEIFGQTYGGSESTSEFGLNIGGGFLYNLGNMDLDVNAKINIISDLNHLTLFAGLRFPIN